MKRFFLVAALVAAFSSSFVRGGNWGPTGCVGRSAPELSVRTGWQQFGENLYYFNRQGIQIAGWDPTHKVYRTFDAASGTWGEPSRPPWETKDSIPETTDAFAETTCQNFGLDRSKCHKAGQPECYTIFDGHQVYGASLQEAGVALTDDSDKKRLTVIGPDPQRSQVLADIGQSEIKDQVLVQGYPPDHWATKPGFVTSGQPTVYDQAPDGKVLHRQDDYQGGATALVGAIRKADPNYKADQDKDKRKPDPVGLPGFSDWLKSGNGVTCCVLAVVAGAAYFYKRKAPS